jgi:rhodanese-related sulfurtransferase
MGDQIKLVPAETVLAWHRTGQAVIVDVREAGEYAAGHIPGALLNSLSTFDPKLVPVASGKKLVVHCHVGKRCQPASARLADSGFKGEINRLQGGFRAWTEIGGPVESGL